MATSSLVRLETVTEQSPQAILDKLDDLLKDCTPLEIEDTHGEDYTTGLDKLKKACASHIAENDRVLAEKTCQLVKDHNATSMDKPFTILSIGCGDGSNDVKILQAIIDKFPEVSVHYIGTDIDEQTCQKAAKVLGALKSQNVTNEFLTFDFEKIDSFKSKIPPCDLILAIHVFYYVENIGKALTNTQELLKDNGKVFVAIKTFQSPKTKLYRRFFLLERKWQMQLDDTVTENLDKLGIAYQIEMIDGEIDFTECFRDGFQTPYQKFLLDFMTHTKMVRYPEAVKKLCIDFLRASAVGKPEKYILPFAVALIVY